VLDINFFPKIRSFPQNLPHKFLFEKHSVDIIVELSR